MDQGDTLKRIDQEASKHDTQKSWRSHSVNSQMIMKDGKINDICKITYRIAGYLCGVQLSWMSSI